MSPIWRNWVLDVTFYRDGGMFCFCPIEDNGTLVVGMNYLGELPPGELTGIVHLDGQGAVEQWIAEHPAEIEQLQKSEAKTALGRKHNANTED